jgi:hypothetical protein
LSFWHALRKELERKKAHLETNDLRSDLLASNLKTLWKAAFKVDESHGGQLMCKLQGNTSFPTHLKTMFSTKGVDSPRVCSLMCAAVPLGERSGSLAPCQSFTYNATSTECKFFEFGQPPKGTWIQSPWVTSGPPCGIDGIRQEIQQMFEADMKQAAANDKQMEKELDLFRVRIAEQNKHTEQITAALNQVEATNSALKNEIVRSEKKITGRSQPVPKSVDPPASTKASPADRVTSQASNVQNQRTRTPAVNEVGRSLPQESSAGVLPSSINAHLAELQPRDFVAVGFCLLIFLLAIVVHAYDKWQRSYTAGKKQGVAQQRNLASQQEAN